MTKPPIIAVPRSVIEAVKTLLDQYLEQNLKPELEYLYAELRAEAWKHSRGMAEWGAPSEGEIEEARTLRRAADEWENWVRTQPELGHADRTDDAGRDLCAEPAAE
jgi:hypothetical protein